MQNRVRRAIGAFIIAATAIAAAAAPASAAPPSDKPDLVGLLPTSWTNPVNVAPVYVDQHAVPGKTLYRFSAVIKNIGGAMDLYRNPSDGHAIQAIWQGGVPQQQPDPNVPPTGGGFTAEDRTPAGASFVYSFAQGHNHWHFQSAARYELLLPGGGSRLSDKVGFCMWDSWTGDAAGNKKWFPVNFVGQGPLTWCAGGHPEVNFTRMGISYLYGDLYSSQSADQWVDITGLASQNYTIRATVNPLGYVDETNTANNVVTSTRLLPGTKATAKTLAVVVNKAKTFQIGGTIKSADIPARNGLLPNGQNGSACGNIRTDTDCYTFITAGSALDFAITVPTQHGSVSIQSETGQKASIKYTPDAGYTGPDTFQFTVTDGRGLTSLPATVTLNVA